MATLSNLTSRDAVLQAISEYDELGREAFLSRYGFGKSRSYVLIHQGKHYDSKAIAGVALQYQPGVGRALKADEFSGGENTVQAKLGELGFVVRAAGETEALAPGIPRVEGDHGDDAILDEHSDRQDPKSKAWMRHETDPFAPVGGYRMLIDRCPAREGTDRAARWPLLVKFAGIPDGVALLDAALKAGDFKVRTARGMLGWCAGEGFVGIGPTERPRVSYPRSLPSTDADDEPFDPESVTDAREKVLREIRARRGQKRFRDALIEAYAARCAITGCDVLDVLEAAHITPYLGPDTNNVTNGLLLRADLHTLFDTQLVAVDPETLKVLVSPRIEDLGYRALHGQTLRPSRTRASAPSEAALRKHREACDF